MGIDNIALGEGIILKKNIPNAVKEIKRDRKSVVQGKSVDLGGRRIIKKKKQKKRKKKTKT